LESHNVVPEYSTSVEKIEQVPRTKAIASRPAPPIDAVVGDFDGDGKLDLAILGLTSRDLELEVWLGDGTGGFTRAASSPMDLGSYSSAEFAMAAGDFNKDGNLDLAIASAVNLPISVQILTGDGAGVAPQVNLELGGFLSGTSGARLEESGGGSLILVTSLFGKAPFFATVLGPDPFAGNQIPIDSGFLYLSNAILANLGATLQVSVVAGFTPAIGQAFTIIHDTSANPIRGIFGGLAEGSTFMVGGFTFQITYKGGAGNDVEVTRVP
jgi:hypothetical protein